jgi:hypothetical protein
MNEGLNDLFYSPDNIRIIKLRRALGERTNCDTRCCGEDITVGCGDVGWPQILPK